MAPARRTPAASVPEPGGPYHKCIPSTQSHVGRHPRISSVRPLGPNLVASWRAGQSEAITGTAEPTAYDHRSLDGGRSADRGRTTLTALISLDCGSFFPTLSPLVNQSLLEPQCRMGGLHRLTDEC
jgi:hypothetical protein